MNTHHWPWHDLYHLKSRCTQTPMQFVLLYISLEPNSTSLGIQNPPVHPFHVAPWCIWFIYWDLPHKMEKWKWVQTGIPGNLTWKRVIILVATGNPEVKASSSWGKPFTSESSLWGSWEVSSWTACHQWSPIQPRACVEIQPTNESTK